MIVGCHGLPPHFEAVYYPSPSRGESATEAKARMEAMREAEQRAWRAEKMRKIWESADSVRENRKAIRDTRSWKSPEYLRKFREYYESNEATVARWNKLGRPKRPSWQIADDDEFEQFLKRFYVDPFLE